MRQFRKTVTNLCGTLRNPKAPTGKQFPAKTTADECGDEESVEEPEKSSTKASSTLKNKSHTKSLKTNVSVANAADIDGVAETDSTVAKKDNRELNFPDIDESTEQTLMERGKNRGKEALKN